MSSVLDVLTQAVQATCDEVHGDLRRILRDLPAEALNWSPGPETNSIYVLVTHLLGSEHFWLANAAGQSIVRDREAEFRARGDDAGALLRLIDEADEHVRAILPYITEQTLAATVPWRDESHSGAWCLLHALEHCGQHRGQTALTRQLWEQSQETA